MMIRSDETEIRGRWKQSGLKVVEDANSQRIEALVSSYLRALGQGESGWSTLFVDPNDGRYWELTYPDSDSHGGGPPMLRNLSGDAARQKYGDAVDA